MTVTSSTTRATWVAIDVAKQMHQVLIETIGGWGSSLRASRMGNVVQRWTDVNEPLTLCLTNR